MAGRFKPGILTVNHFDLASFTTAAATTNQRAIHTVVETPTNRGADLPVGAVLTSIHATFWATDATPVNGKHECFMLFQPGATTYSDPISAWLDTTEPMTEEAIQVRQNKMAQYHRTNIVSGAARPLIWSCRWRGRKVLRDGDDIVVCVRDAAITNWEGNCVTKFVV